MQVIVLLLVLLPVAYALRHPAERTSAVKQGTVEEDPGSFSKATKSAFTGTDTQTYTQQELASDDGKSIESPLSFVLAANSSHVMVRKDVMLTQTIIDNDFFLVLGTPAVAGKEAGAAVSLFGERHVSNASFGALPKKEQSFLDELHSLAVHHGVWVMADMDNPFYVFEHLTPIVRALGSRGRLAYWDAGRAASRAREATQLGLQRVERIDCNGLQSYLASSPSHHLINLHPLKPCPGYPGSSCAALESAYGAQMTRLWHGIDDTGTLLAPNRGWRNLAEAEFRGEGSRGHLTSFPSLAFSRNPLRREATLPDVKAQLNLPKDRQLLVYLPSIDIHEYSVSEGLSMLSRTLSVVIKKHPLNGPLLIDSHVSLIGDDISWRRLVQAADMVVVPCKGSVTSGALLWSTPVVYLCKQSDLSTLRLYPKGTFLDDSNAVVVEGESLAGRPAMLVEAVQRAFDDETVKRKESRRNYARRLMGCVDGYEAYRVATMLVLKAAQAGNSKVSNPALQRLKDKYNQMDFSSVFGVDFDGRCPLVEV